MCRGLVRRSLYGDTYQIEVVCLDFQMLGSGQAGIALLSLRKYLLKIRKVQQLDGHPRSS